MSSVKCQGKGLYRSASASTVNGIRRLNQQRRATFLMPTKFICEEAGQVGYLLNTIFNYHRPAQQATTYKTFFCNSRIEAMHGAIKIARHNQFRKSKHSRREILIYDPTRQWELIFDPLQKGKVRALLGGVSVISHQSYMMDFISYNEGLGAVILPAHEDLTFEFASEILRICRGKGIITIIDESKSQFLNPDSSFVNTLSLPADVIVTGEALTDFQIPFGAFSMSAKTYQPWNNPIDFLIHSSTFGGNRLALSVVRDQMLKGIKDFGHHSEYRQTCLNIGKSREARIEAFARYVNPVLVGLYGINGYDFNPDEAHGATLKLKSDSNGLEREIIDCMSGGGAVVRGHTPEDIVTDVLDTHDDHQDYWGQVTGEICTKTGLSHAFAAVSGATAVDTGMTLALLAHAERSRVIVFKENYAGKTLISLNATDAHDEDLRSPFQPLYHDVVYLDPYDINSGARLREELCSQKVALVWFEIIQGQTIKRIPEELLETIARCKDEGGYFIGVDEILAGFYRTGNLFSYEKTMVTPDIVTFSKALSDGTFPVGMTCVSHAVYERARQNGVQAVDYLESLYINQIGAHVAEHCVKKITAGSMADHVQRVSSIISTGLNKAAKGSAIFKEVAGEGLLLQLRYRYDHILLKCLGKIAPILFPLYMSGVALKRADVFLAIDRCMPALTMSEEEAHRLVERLTMIFSVHPLMHIVGFYGFFFRLIGFSLIGILRRHD